MGYRVQLIMLDSDCAILKTKEIHRGCECGFVWNFFHSHCKSHTSLGCHGDVASDVAKRFILKCMGANSPGDGLETSPV